MGGGRSHMRPKGAADEEYTSPSSLGRRIDGRDLIAEWLESMPSNTSRSELVSLTKLNGLERKRKVT